MLRSSLRLLASSLFVALALNAPASAQEPSKISTMGPVELGRFVDSIASSVGRDALGLAKFSADGDCLELYRTANAFTLGYGLLEEARAAAQARSAQGAAVLGKVIQVRVLTFAARLKAEEWMQVCADFVVPADKQDDPRYARPVLVTNAEFGDAATEARQGAALNFGAAVAAARSGECAAVVSAAQSISLYLPYLDKLAKDLAQRPLALGPRVSRRAILDDKARLTAAEADLWTNFGAKCGNPNTPATAPGA